MKFYNQFPNWCNITVEKVRHAPMITNTKKVPKTTRFFHRYFFHRYFLVSITHSKKSYDVIKLGYFINYLWTPTTITYLKIIKIEALLFSQNSTISWRPFSIFVHILFTNFLTPLYSLWYPCKNCWFVLFSFRYNDNSNVFMNSYAS